MITYAKDLPNHKEIKQAKDFKSLELEYGKFIKWIDWILNRAYKLPTTIDVLGFKSEPEKNPFRVYNRGASIRLFKKYMNSKGYSVSSYESAREIWHFSSKITVSKK